MLRYMRHHFHSKSYKRKTFIWGGSRIDSEVQFIIIKTRSMVAAGRHGVGIIAENPTSYRPQEANWVAS